MIFQTRNPKSKFTFRYFRIFPFCGFFPLLFLQKLFLVHTTKNKSIFRECLFFFFFFSQNGKCQLHFLNCFTKAMNDFLQNEDLAKHTQEISESKRYKHTIFRSEWVCWTCQKNETKIEMKYFVMFGCLFDTFVCWLKICTF